MRRMQQPESILDSRQALWQTIAELHMGSGRGEGWAALKAATLISNKHPRLLTSLCLNEESHQVR